MYTQKEINKALKLYERLGSMGALLIKLVLRPYIKDVRLG